MKAYNHNTPIEHHIELYKELNTRTIFMIRKAQGIIPMKTIGNLIVGYKNKTILKIGNFGMKSYKNLGSKLKEQGLLEHFPMRR